MTNLSPEQLRELKEIAEKATPGPWSLTDYDYIRPDCLKGRKPLAEPATGYESWPAICDVKPWPQHRWDCLGEAESHATQPTLPPSIPPPVSS